jgi:hypothetical protein
MVAVVNSEIGLRPGPAAGHRDRVLIRRETERDADVIRAITTAAFGQGRPPGQVVPEARLIDELRSSPPGSRRRPWSRSPPQARRSATC